MTSQDSSQERRLKLRIHARTEDSRLSLEGEDIGTPPELLISQDLALADGTIVVISQARWNADSADAASDDKYRNELVLRATVNWKMKNIRRQQVSLRGDLAERFGFRNMGEVFISQLAASARPLTLVEFGFKDDYISRSDYWHFSDTLVNSCLYVEQVMEQNGIKAHVLQLYDDTNKVNSGIISTNTRVVFRSSSAQIFLFVQLSAEMWEFDELGDIYFERAVKKFIRPLCSNWQQNHCHHEITVVYFSRTIYLSESWDQFPEETVRRKSVQRLDSGTFYQDFYKVIIQDEIRSDWSSIIQTLKREFFQYKRNIGLTDPCPGMPQCYNSQARYGNFLEAINLTLNIFEQHYYDRILDRSGQQFAMITASQGVFENSLELIEITERRMLDYGVGTDIIFLTRQPLHAVPLFIYQDNTREISPHTKYHVAAHWLNFSYLGEDMTMDIRRDSPKSFQPVLKLPDDTISPFRGRSGESDMRRRGCRNPLGKVMNEFWVDEKPKEVDMLTYMRLYDAQIWKDASELPQLWETFSQTPLKISPSSSPNTVNTPLAHHLNTPTIIESHSYVSRLTDSSISSLPFPQLSQTISLPGFLGRPTPFNSLSSSYPHDLFTFSGGTPSSLGSSIPEFASINTPRRPASSQGNTMTHSLEINPFNRNCQLTQTSSSRRRWAHCFPASNRGIIFRDNYLRDSEAGQDSVQVFHGCNEPVFAFSDFQDGFKSKCTDVFPLGEDRFSPLFDEIKPAGLRRQPAVPYNQSAPTCGATTSRLADSFLPHRKLHRSYSAPDSAPALKAVGEVVEAFVKRGINWKSLVHPALCPITNDYFPGDSILKSDQYYLSTNIIIETLVSVGTQSCEQQVLSAIRELISQRLVCGFQLITTNHGNVFSINELLNINNSSMPFSSSGTKLWLSLGEVYHELTVLLNSSYNQLEYTANVYNPTNLKRHSPITYLYNLWPIGRSSFELAELTFQQSDLWTERWSHFDLSIWKKEYHQIMQQQDTFWRVQFILLPESLPPDLLSPRNGDRAAEWRKAKFLNFTTFLDQINAAKQKMSQRGAFSDPINRRSSKLKSEDPDSAATKDKLYRCIRQGNWYELVETIQDAANSFTGYFHISASFPCAPTNYFILSKLTDYLTDKLAGLLTGEEVWTAVLTLGKKGFISRFDDPTFSIQSNGYYICSFQGGPAEGHSRLPHGASAEQICAIEVLWDQTYFLTPRSNAPLDPPSLPPIHPDFNEGQRICPLLDALLPPLSSGEGSASSCTSVVHLSHDKAYSPFAGFRIELQFRVASTSLLNQAVSEFKHFAHKSGYVLTLYPSCHTLSDLFLHPFRRPYHIPLLLPSNALLDIPRVVQIMTLIAFKFGFIKESHLSFVPSSPYTPAQLGKDRFTHFTGQYFVTLVPQGLDRETGELANGACSPDKEGYYSRPGFLWWNNFLLNRKSRSRVACKEHNADLSSMIAFCAGLNGELERFILESRN